MKHTHQRSAPRPRFRVVPATGGVRFRHLVLVGASLLGTLGAPTVEAHEFWLSPVAYPNEDRGATPIYAFVGQGLRAEPVRYSAPYTASFLQYVPTDAAVGATDTSGSPATVPAASGFMPDANSDASARSRLGADSSRAPSFVSIDLAARASHGDATFARLDHAAGSLVTFVSHFSDHEMAGADFDDYLRSEGLDPALEARMSVPDPDAVVRERFRRSAKLYIPAADDGSGRGRVADRTGSSPRVDPCARLGLPLEIVPLQDPARFATVQFQVLYEGAPLGHAWVRVWHSPEIQGEPARRPDGAAEPRFEGRASEDGIVTLEIGDSGEWLVAVVHMVPSEDPNSDWDSTWASVTFQHQ